MKLKTAALAAALWSGAAFAQAIPSGDPAAVSSALVAMGYKPGAIQPNGGMPLFNVSINNFDSVFVFGACTGGKDCKYMLLVSRFTDVKNPPATWVNGHNENLDLGKLWVTPDGTLAFSLPVPTGGESMTPAMLRFILEQWAGVIGSVSQSAVTEKLTK